MNCALLLSVLLASAAAFGTLDGGCADKEENLPTIVAMMPAEDLQAIPAGAMTMMNTCAGMQTAGALLCTMDEENFMLTRTCQKTCNALSCGMNVADAVVTELMELDNCDVLAVTVTMAQLMVAGGLDTSSMLGEEDLSMEEMALAVELLCPMSDGTSEQANMAFMASFAQQHNTGTARRLADPDKERLARVAGAVRRSLGKAARKVRK